MEGFKLDSFFKKQHVYDHSYKLKCSCHYSAHGSTTNPIYRKTQLTKNKTPVKKYIDEKATAINCHADLYLLYCPQTHKVAVGKTKQQKTKCQGGKIFCQTGQQNETIRTDRSDLSEGGSEGGRRTADGRRTDSCGEKYQFRIWKISAAEPERSRGGEIKRMFVNFSNHPSQNWGAEQRKAALVYGEIRDVMFPAVPAMAEMEEVTGMAEECAKKILQLKPDCVMCQGEFTLTYAIVRKLKERKIPALAACSSRRTEETVNENGSTQKSTVFIFERFRKY